MDAAILLDGSSFSAEFMQPQIDSRTEGRNSFMSIESGKGYDLVCLKGMDQRNPSSKCSPSMDQATVGDEISRLDKTKVEGLV